MRRPNQMFVTTNCDVRKSDSNAVRCCARHCLLPRSPPHLQHRQHLCGNMSQRSFGCKLIVFIFKVAFPRASTSPVFRTCFSFYNCAWMCNFNFM